MNPFILLILGFFALAIGVLLGYFVRQSLAKRQAGTIEAKLQKKITQAKAEAEQLFTETKEKAQKILDEVKRQEEIKRREFLRTEDLSLKRESMLVEKTNILERQEKELTGKVNELKRIKEILESLKAEAEQKLETISGLNREEAKTELLSNLEKSYQEEILQRLRKLEDSGKEKLNARAKEIVALAIQKYSASCSSEITTTTVALPNEEIKGRIIGKEGRNIHTLEKLTGVEIIVDDTPEVVVISAFDPVRRQIAKTALEKLIHDGRIQPAKIEDQVIKAQEEILAQIKEAGETACYEVGILGLDPKLVQLLGRLKFRTSYGQNVLLHSMETSYLATALASEIGADVQVVKKAGLLHDIGKAMDHQIQGSHVDIGVKILEKFGVEPEVIKAMKSHHEEYPFESLEAVLVQSADAISGARPGARKESLENYIKRLTELENIALSKKGVEKAYAIQAGREIRVFVKPDEIDDLGARKLAREVADGIQEELKYPGEIKVTVLRETRVVEYAR